MPVEPGTTDPAFDVFVSYRRTDQEWVKERVARILSNCRTHDSRRARVFLDSYSLRAGSPWHMAIDSAIRIARRFVPVWTAGFWDSEICRHEMEVAQSCDPEGTRGFIVPVWDGRCPLPEPFGSMHAHQVGHERFLDLLCRDLGLTPADGEDEDDWLYESILGLDRTRGGRKLLTITPDNVGRLSEVGKLAGHRDGVHGLACGPEPNQLVSAGFEDLRNWESSVKVWEAKTGREVRSFKCQDPGKLVVSLDGSSAISSGHLLSSHVDLRAGRESHRLLGDCAAILPDNQRAILGTNDGMLLCCDLGSGEALWTYGRRVIPKQTRWERLWRRKREPITVAHDAAVQGIAVTADGARVFSMDARGVLKCWNLVTRAELDVWSVPTYRRSPIAMDAAGKHLCWDGGRLGLRTGELREIHGSDGRIHDLAVSPDGRLLAMASPDTGLTVASTDSGGLLCQLGFDDMLWAVDFSSDQRRIFVGGGRQRMHDWLSSGIFVLGVVGAFEP
jgi:TIR domain-containing protein/WD40 domain-containing protein